MRPRRAALILATVAAAALVAAAVTLTSDGTPSNARPGGGDAAPGSAARFIYLAAQRSNRCDLSPGSVNSMDGTDRLQGSCCTAMNETRYRSQVDALRRYRQDRLIPTDPNDVPVALAQRLLRADTNIKLSPGQRAAYRRAITIAPEGGPCCCHCWRWTAFRGLAKHLLARRGWSAAQVGGLIGNLDGCGGAAA